MGCVATDAMARYVGGVNYTGTNRSVYNIANLHRIFTPPTLHLSQT